MTGTLRGRVDKRRAILAAAASVFARDGYDRAGVDAIAAAAGVAKPTVYNHFGDKQTLFREAVAADADRARAEHLATLDRLRDPTDDVRAALEDAGFHLLACWCAERSRALRRLLAAEAGRFPDLVDVVRGRAADPVTEALADRLARLSLTGRLGPLDPTAAAEHFLALLTGPAEGRARLGTRTLPDAELCEMTRSAVEVFLRAYGPEAVRGA